ncbi:restriction endonuclease subunit S [Campylobacter concisus]|uniref:restriction endonuclease subunit S n=1 Tax=Campylobacter concisus TaxID=199 RepID=UPI00122D2914|nr:restriction endonuclease subunit S [Campylobacter concisus]MBE9835016.1 restriction endonuclease subunit S [Campylobacter concisus]MBE9857401.1 restriction endonuclease subunit S [Campylobacter concisus]
MSEFKNLPSGWKVVKLEKVAPLQRGYDLPTDNIKEGLYPVVYSNGILRFHNEFKAKGPGVITGRSGTIGKVVYVEEDYWPHNTSLWVTNFYDNNPKFIYYMYINLNLARFSAGSGVPTLNRNDIHAQTIPLPPLDEQEKIAEILSTWDEAINLTINLIESKKQFKKALMQNLLTAKVRFPEFKDEWIEVTIGELFEFKKGQGLSKEMLDTNGKFECVLYGELYTTYDEIIENVKSRTNFQGSIKSKFDDILIPSSTTTGSIDIAIAAVILKNDVLLGGDINILRKKRNNIYGKFVAYCITNIKNKELSSYAQGTTIIHLYAKDFKDMKIKLPNLKEQQKIAEVLTACDDEINLLNLKLENLKKQKQGLMQKLLKGEIRTCYVKKAM